MDFLKELPSKIQELWNSNLEIFNLLKEWKGKINKWTEFWDVFFTIVPFEVLLLLVFTALLMVLINNISPNSPRINLTIGVFLFAISYLYIVHLFTNEWKIGRILYISSFLLVPAYILEISKFGKKSVQKYMYRKLRKDTGILQSSIVEIHEKYGKFLQSQTKISENPTDFFNSLKSLQKSLHDLENLVESTKEP
jgi:hypothetical protein